MKWGWPHWTPTQYFNVSRNALFEEGTFWKNSSYMTAAVLKINSQSLNCNNLVYNIRHEKPADMQNNMHCQAFSTTAHYWQLEFWIWDNGVFKASIQTHWKLGIKILIDQVSNWNYEESTWSYKHFNNYVAWQTLV